jgi:hypothetical protein
MKCILFLIVLFLLAGCNTEPPEAKVIVNENTEISTFRGTYHWTEGAAEYDVPPQLVDSQNMDPVEVEGGAVGIVTFDDGSDPAVSVREWHRNEPAAELDVRDREVTFPEEPGMYILEISAEWEGEFAKSSSYTFYVEIVQS